MKLAIKGHATRGKEVIQLLEMLGGNNKLDLKGNEESFYSIDNDNIIICDDLLLNGTHRYFTLEEYEKLYPYKIGDKVTYVIPNKPLEITKMVWNEEENSIVYQADYCWCYAENLQPYKETMKAESDEKLSKKFEVSTILSIVPFPDGKFIISPRQGYEIKQEGDEFYLLPKNQYSHY